eukprot:m.510180 g.510180  ORF g.510180 m.510180 type:complete len:748 (-) comp21889_c0_seq42:33-2276(-)
MAEIRTFVCGWAFVCVVLMCLCTNAAHINSVAQSIIIPTTPGAIQKAFDNLPASGDVELRLAAGVHTVATPIMLHSGQKLDGSRQIKVIADDAQKTSSISGGITIPSASWTSVPGKSNLWTAPLPAGTDTSESSTLQAWRGDVRLTLARSKKTLKYVHATDDHLVFTPGDVLASYHSQENVHVVLYESWTASLHKIKSIDSANNTLFLATSFNAQWANSASGARYYVANAMELLDQEDEFYVDKTTNSILVMASQNPSLGDEVVLAQTIELLRINGTSTAPVSGITWSNLVFQHSAVETDKCFSGGCDGQSADFLTTAAVHLTHASNIVFENCAFTHTGGYAVWLSVGTTASTVEGCAISDVGSGGVRIGIGHGADGNNNPADQVLGNYVANNVMSDGGHVYQQGCGVLAQNVGNTTITHNEIHHFRYTGVSTGWTWGYGPTNVHAIITSFNSIHHIGLGYLSDMGCVYTLGHQPQSRVENNICTDVQSYNYGGWAYYTDEGSRDEVFTNNIATRTKCAGHHQHYGTDNDIVNNLYYNVNIGDVPTPGRSEILMTVCDSAIRASTHARPWSCHPDTHPTTGCCCYPSCDQGKCSSFAFDRNIVAQPKGYNGTLIGTTNAYGLLNFSFANNTYFVDGVADTADLWNSTGTNAAAGKGGESFATWKNVAGKDSGSLYTDPEIVNFTSWQVSDSSPALKEGFQQIDISTVGPRMLFVGPSSRPTRVADAVAILGADTHRTLQHRGFVRTP